ncbi:hypothetical protein DUNSADRAFT_14037 [Dunaliella salina]|uniref:Uncharacterized protein n=1 Tax=Dunaliella salina TaxID=3046 RepID=A0ABQ7H318_DUNSA|nr:hypothetical protein DUNSADRAFT_14037 [Dunaliella salina]|eukprot:KAF5841206.1 hypothetical protein DUNSADRAFT_14037 [Dunaliella salina]
MQASHKLQASSCTRSATTSKCVKPPSVQPSSGRRAALLSIGTALLIAQRPGFAKADTCANIELDANARRLRGERDLEEEAIALECRKRDIPSELEASGYDKAAGRKTAGPAPNVSARKMYIAVDAVIAFLASNGLAPLPKGKKDATKKSLDEARSFLAKGV